MLLNPLGFQCGSAFAIAGVFGTTWRFGHESTDDRFSDRHRLSGDLLCVDVRTSLVGFHLGQDGPFPPSPHFSPHLAGHLRLKP